MKNKWFNLIIIGLIIAIVGIIMYIFFFNKDEQVINISFDKNMIKLYVGEYETLNVSVSPNDDNIDLIWNSSNSDVVSVTNSGIISAKRVGDSFISVSTKDNKYVAKCYVTVIEIPVTPTPTIEPTVTPVPTPEPTPEVTKTPISTPTSVPIFPQMSVTLNSGMKKVAEYNSETLKYWIERGTFNGNSDYHKMYGTTNIYLTHIWLKNPENQIKIALGGGTTLGNNQPMNLIQNEINRNGYSNKGLVAFNSSFFGDSRISEWGSSQSSRIIIYNGKIIRDDCQKDFGSGKAIYSSYGITKDGQIKFYNTGRMDVCDNYKQQMLDEGVKYSGAAYGEIGKNTVDNAKQGYSRTMICPINRNNVIMISAYNLKFDSASKIAYNILGCQTLINIDGGGSTTLLYKTNKNSIESTSFVTSRKLADMLYFVE